MVKYSVYLNNRTSGRHPGRICGSNNQSPEESFTSWYSLLFSLLANKCTLSWTYIRYLLRIWWSWTPRIERWSFESIDTVLKERNQIKCSRNGHWRCPGSFNSLALMSADTFRLIGFANREHALEIQKTTTLLESSHCILLLLGRKGARLFGV